MADGTLTATISLPSGDLTGQHPGEAAHHG
jgi:hypothetical protein